MRYWERLKFLLKLPGFRAGCTAKFSDIFENSHAVKVKRL